MSLGEAALFSQEQTSGRNTQLPAISYQHSGAGGINLLILKEGFYKLHKGVSTMTPSIYCIFKALNALSQECKKNKRSHFILCSRHIVWSTKVSHTIQISASNLPWWETRVFFFLLFLICHEQIRGLITHEQHTACTRRVEHLKCATPYSMRYVHSSPT